MTIRILSFLIRHTRTQTSRLIPQESPTTDDSGLIRLMQGIRNPPDIFITLAACASTAWKSASCFAATMSPISTSILIDQSRLERTHIAKNGTNGTTGPISYATTRIGLWIGSTTGVDPDRDNISKVSNPSLRVRHISFRSLHQVFRDGEAALSVFEPRS